MLSWPAKVPACIYFTFTRPCCLSACFRKTLSQAPLTQHLNLQDLHCQKLHWGNFMELAIPFFMLLALSALISNYSRCCCCCECYVCIYGTFIGQLALAFEYPLIVNSYPMHKLVLPSMLPPLSGTHSLQTSLSHLHQICPNRTLWYLTWAETWLFVCQ